MVFLELLPWIVSALVGAVITQLIAFCLAVKYQRIDIVDVFWGISFIAIVLALWLHASPLHFVTAAVSMMVVAWGGRLSWHIGQRFARSAVQDERYTELVSKWPTKNRIVQASYKIFLLQALLATIISLPVIVLFAFRPYGDWLMYVGGSIWVVGFIMEVVADKQLKEYVNSAPRGSLMRTGLWKYSRHPNYFGELTMWWGIAVIAGATPAWWLGIIGALTITVLLCFVSGIPPAERRAMQKVGWAEYKKQTSILLPLPPRR